METNLKLRKTLITILIIIILTPLALYGWITRSNGKIQIDGKTRRYVVHKPDAYDASEPTALVLSLHGFSDWPMHHMRMSGWNHLADSEGFIVVYPMGTGFPLRWNAYAKTEEDGSPNADVAFLQALIERLKKEFNIDSEQIFVNGLSNGAGMSQMLACELGEEISALGGVAGAYLLSWEACQTEQPIPAMLFHGTEDPIVSYAGGQTSRSGAIFPDIPEFAASWAERNQCDPEAIKTIVSSSITRTDYRDCAGGSDVVLFIIQNGGHTWPGGCCLPKRIAGETTQEINATSLMWAFYQSQITQ